MNKVVSEALIIAYEYASALNFAQDMEPIEKALKSIAGVSEFTFSGQISFASSYEDIQDILSKINEKESIRKSKGVYYTPSDVVRFIVANTAKSSMGALTPDNINSEIVETDYVEDFCLEKSVLEPTCGAGEFLLSALELKFDLWNSLHDEISKDTIQIIVGTMFGNDINEDSVIISKLRLFLSAIHRYGIDLCDGLDEVLNRNFTCNDYVVFPPDIERRYDIILGNPPYVEDHKSGLELKEKYGNIYANVLNNAAERLKPGGSMGFIIPLSYSSTPRMKKIREKLLEITPEQYILCYADRPDCLFDSVHQKLCILISKNTDGDPCVYTGNYQYWYQEERNNLFSRTTVIKNHFIRDDCIPKLGNAMDESIFAKIINPAFPTVYSVSREGTSSVYVNRREAFWIKAFRETIIHPEFKVFSYAEPEEADYCYCLVNSSLFWWYWISVSDCWHVSKTLNSFQAPTTADFNYASELAKKLSLKLEETKMYVGTKQTEYEYKHKECLDEIHAIDDYVNGLFGLTEEESEYIKGFALRYRVSGGAANENN